MTACGASTAPVGGERAPRARDTAGYPRRPGWSGERICARPGALTLQTGKPGCVEGGFREEGARPGLQSSRGWSQRRLWN